jgi:hypothetical protein
MQKEADSVGEVGPSSKKVSKIQIVPIEMLFHRSPIDLPGTIDLPEVGRFNIPAQPKKSRKRIEGQSEMLFSMEPAQEGYVASAKTRPSRSIRPVEIEVTRVDSSHRKAK